MSSAVRSEKVAEKIYRISDSIYRLGPLGEPRVLSSYLIIDDKVSIVDCGPSAVVDELLTLARQCGVRASDIDNLLLTHVHLDHAGGASLFLQKCPSAATYVPERGYKHMLDPRALNASSKSVLGEIIFNYWKECGAVEKERLCAVKPNEQVWLGRTQVQYLPATGHAPHHNVIFDERDSCIFSADALGIFDETTGSLIPTTPPPSLDLPQFLKDLDMIEGLRPKVACMAHYEEVSPSKEYFSSLRGVFEVWSEKARNYVARKKSTSYSWSDYDELFKELETAYPEYSKISASLREQALRVDVAGLVDYFAKQHKMS